jgi:nicotinate-nucleotide adenylyltransferase
MARLAADGDEILEVSDLEVARGGISYTVDTLEQLRGQLGETELVLLVGADAALEFASWHETERVARLARVAVFNRAGHPPLGRERLIEAGLPESAQLITIRSPLISASAIRARLRAGEDSAAELPRPVVDYIRSHHLYRVSQAAAD